MVLVLSDPVAQVGVIVGGAVLGRVLLAPPVVEPTGPEPSAIFA